MYDFEGFRGFALTGTFCPSLVDGDMQLKREAFAAAKDGPAPEPAPAPAVATQNPQAQQQ
jgi:hypothetical protein